MRAADVNSVEWGAQEAGTNVERHAFTSKSCESAVLTHRTLS